MPGTNPGTASLASWWKLDEETGVRVDAHGSNDLSETNTVGFAAGKQGNAADFELDNNEYVSGAFPSATHAGDFAFGVWVLPESLTGNRNLWRLASRQVEVITLGAKVRFQVQNGGGSVTLALAAGSWSFLVMMYTASTKQTFIQRNNGTSATSTAATGVTASATTLFLSSPSGALGLGPYDGLQDEAFWFSSVLTADERTFLWNDGAGVTYEDVAGGAGSPLSIFAAQHAAMSAGGVAVG